MPANLVTGLAAGLRFAHPADPVAQELQAKIRSEGHRKDARRGHWYLAHEKLGQMILERYADLPIELTHDVQGIACHDESASIGTT